MRLIATELLPYVSGNGEIEVEYEDIPGFREALGTVVSQIDEYILGTSVPARSERVTRRRRPTSRRGVQRKRTASATTRENVKQVLVNMKAPATTKDIAKVAKVSQSLAGKALKDLVASGEVIPAGKVPGVKGIRPLYELKR